MADRLRQLESAGRAASRPLDAPTFSMDQGDEGQVPPAGAGQDLFSGACGGGLRGPGGGCGHQAFGGQPVPAGIGHDMFSDGQQTVVKAAWDAMKGLQLSKLEYQGRRSRAEQFAIWKDLIALQIQSLARQEMLVGMRLCPRLVTHIVGAWLRPTCREVVSEYWIHMTWSTLILRGDFDLFCCSR